MTLSSVWFVIVAFFWTGFFVLEGFDFGVGALHKIVGRTDTERRVAINTIGPVWDGTKSGWSRREPRGSRRSRPGTRPGSRPCTWPCGCCWPR